MPVRTPLPPVVGGVKIEQIHTLGDNSSVAVVHHGLYTAPGPLDDSQVAAIATAAWDGWNSQVMIDLSEDLEHTSAVVTDLSVIGGVQHSVGGSQAGGIATHSSAAHNALLINLKTARRGRSFTGRMYLPGIPLTEQTGPQSWDPTYAGTTMPGEINDYDTALQAATPSVFISVVSYFSGTDPTTGKPIRRVTPLNTPLTGIFGDLRIATQRRRGR